MSNDAGGFPMANPSPPGYPPPGYPPPGFQGYPPPAYQGYPPPGSGYPPPGYPPPGYAVTHHRDSPVRHRVTAPQVAIRRPVIPHRDIPTDPPGYRPDTVRRWLRQPSSRA